MARMPEKEDEFQYWSRKKRTKYHAAFRALYSEGIKDEQLDKHGTEEGSQTTQETNLP